MKTKITKIKHIGLFGIKKATTKEGEAYFYSDPERTILDLAYIGRYNGETDEEIRNKIIGYDFDKKKLKRYMKRYPKTIEALICHLFQ